MEKCISQTVCNKRLTEAQGFAVELRVDRKGLRDENVILCQKDVNVPNKEISRIKLLVKGDKIFSK